jgi:hypothetical protein
MILLISPHVQELIRNLGIASSTGIAEEEKEY